MLAHIGQQCIRGVEVRQVFIPLVFKVGYKFPFQVVFTLIGFTKLNALGISIQNDKLIGFGNGLVVNHVSASFL